MSLTFAEFQAMNKARCEGGFLHPVAWNEPSWPLQNWCLAVAGEAGELCNLVKKCLRGDFTVPANQHERAPDRHAGQQHTIRCA